MDADLAALPDDIDALKAALMIERARMREAVAERDVGAAELAVARAKASADMALIAHQKLRIELTEKQTPDEICTFLPQKSQDRREDALIVARASEAIEKAGHSWIRIPRRRKLRPGGSDNLLH